MKNLASAKQLAKDVIDMCKSGSFDLTKSISSKKELLLSVPEHQRNLGVKDQDLTGDLPSEKALGILWNSREDIFSFELKLEARTLIKRVMLSMISSIYNLLRFAATFTLEGRRTFKGLYNQDMQWNSQVSGAVKKDRKIWFTKLEHIETLHVRRYMKPDNVDEVVNISLHNFCDASELG